MLTLVVAAILANQAAAPIDPAREALVAGTIQWLRSTLPDPPSTQFRRVYVRSSRRQDGIEHLSICGQALQDDARAPVGWRAFGTTRLKDGEIAGLLGPGSFGSAETWCLPGPLQKWDYDHDLSARFAADLTRR